jgi:hypothetical protein
MPGIRILDRVEKTIQEVLDARLAPDDVMEWAVNVVPTMEGCEDHPSMELCLAIFFALACPEDDSRIVAQVLVPLGDCGTPTLTEEINDIYDRIVLSRMVNSADLDVSGS